MSSAIFGFKNNGQIKKMFIRENGEVEKLGCDIREKLCIYPMYYLSGQADRIVLINIEDPNNIPTDFDIDMLINGKYIDLDKAKEFVAKELKEPFNMHNWLHLLAEWYFEPTIGSYVLEGITYMIQPTSKQEEEAEWEYILDLDNGDLIITSCAETRINVNKLILLTKKGFLDLVYENERQAMKDFESEEN